MEENEPKSNIKYISFATSEFRTLVQNLLQ